MASSPIVFETIQEPDLFRPNDAWTREEAPLLPLAYVMESRVELGLWGDETEEEDIIQVELEADDLLVARLSALSQGQLVLEDPDGAVLATTEGDISASDPLELIVPIDEDGTYSIVVSDPTREYDLPAFADLRVRRFGGQHEGLINKSLLNAETDEGIFVTENERSLSIAGPVGIGFELIADWEIDTVTQEDGTPERRFQTEESVFLRTEALGTAPLAVPPGLTFSVSTTPTEFGDRVGLLESVDWLLPPALEDFLNPIRDAFDFELDLPVDLSLPRFATGVELGRSEALESTQAPVNDNIPYLFFELNAGIGLEFGGIELSFSIGAGLSVVLDPADVFLYIGGRAEPKIGQVGGAGSEKGYIPFEPATTPRGYEGDGVFGNVYIQGEVDLTKLIGFPLGGDVELVADFDVDDDGRLFGGFFDNPSRFVSGGFDKELFGEDEVEALTDIAFGLNGELSAGFEFGSRGNNGGGSNGDSQNLFSLSVPLGEGTLIYDPAAFGLFVRAGTVNPFEDTILDYIVPTTRVDVDGYIRFNGEFDVRYESNYEIFGYDIAGFQVIIQNFPNNQDNSGIFGRGRVEILGSRFTIGGAIQSDGDFRFSASLVSLPLSGPFGFTTANVRGNLIFRNDDGNVSFKANFSADVRTAIESREFGGGLQFNLDIGNDGDLLTYDGSVNGTIFFGRDLDNPSDTWFQIDAGLRIYADRNEFGLEIDLPALSVIEDAVGGFLSFFGFASPSIPDRIRVTFPRDTVRPEPISPPAPLPPPMERVELRRELESDFDGDGRADLGLYHFDPDTNEGVFEIQFATGEAEVRRLDGLNENDIPLPGDFDGDGRSDIAVVQPLARLGGSEIPNASVWIYIQSSNGLRVEVSFGAPGVLDRPAPADFDGDGVTDIATFRANSDVTPGAAEWFILPSGTGKAFSIPFGAGGGFDLPAPSDFDGDGRADIVTFRPVSDLVPGAAQWFLLPSGQNDSTFSDARGAFPITFGAAGNADQPVVGDYNNDGRSDIAAFRSDSDLAPGQSQWFILPSSGDSPEFGSGFPVTFGVAGEIASLADYDGDGIPDFGVFDQVAGEWQILDSSTESDRGVDFGASGSSVVPINAPLFFRLKATGNLPEDPSTASTNRAMDSSGIGLAVPRSIDSVALYQAQDFLASDPEHELDRESDPSTLFDLAIEGLGFNLDQI